MRFLFQLNLDLLPKELGDRFGTGLLQVFHCNEDRCPAPKAPNYNPGHVVRIIQPNGPPIPSDQRENLRDALRITSWRRSIELPHFMEGRKIGIEPILFPDRDRNVDFVRCEPLDIEFGVTSKNFLYFLMPSQKDKLAGWPYWVQDAIYPKCRRCKSQMQFLFQLGNHDHPRSNNGHTGVSIITQCPRHKDVVAFSEGVS
jgi:hypothetical protein